MLHDDKLFFRSKNSGGTTKSVQRIVEEVSPDNENGSTKITQQINQEYDALFSILSKEKQSDGQSYTYEENERFKAILNEIIGFNMTVEVIGCWIWCFDCYSYKNQLKSFGFTWSSKKKSWVWHDEPYHRHHKKEIPLSHIRAKYGSEIISKTSKCTKPYIF